MNSKTINFDYTGGTQTQDFRIRGTNLPWTYECEDKWIAITKGATSLAMNVRTIYDFYPRIGVIKVFDRFRNEIDLVIEQTGYYDLHIDMPTSIVLYEDFYEENNTYDVYLTVYGGPLQLVDCKELEPYIEKVWDNSDMYNDFILRIPKDLSGTFTVRHSDALEFKDFCQDHAMEYDKDQMEKTLSIVQVTKEDVIGEMVIECDGERYTNRNEPKQIDVRYDRPTEIDCVYNTFMTVTSCSSYTVTENAPVNVSVSPDWVNVRMVGNKIILQCTEQNMFADRYSMVKLVNSANPMQYIRISIRQENKG